MIVAWVEQMIIIFRIRKLESHNNIIISGGTREHYSRVPPWFNDSHANILASQLKITFSFASPRLHF